MADHDIERAEALILRAWIELGRPNGLRVRITRVIPGEPEVTGIAMTVDDVVAAVRDWLEGLSEPGSRPSG
jgi:hypothetical protein